MFVSAVGAHAVAGAIPCRPSEVRGTEVPPSPWGVVLIVVVGESEEDLTDEDVDFTIAHEIAHHWCGHKTLVDATTYEQQEQEADATANAWGFQGRATRIT